ncbi:NADP-dependent phosphogluconate dehydrogenase [Aestuariivita sp.]|jgi:6-phosphogluconate dehydrogenase|uniref:NADP-dependent phosphogluconate dehydrogenase n=1 Tax=Aestuariivita sp. TaxID=1872407 RepID=UPI00216C5A1E|nr:NADP-dependent phosphogluconate dehydrogenase [Aestuariivita sp.]MCE8008007.1 NADP-dependent phosphogluconate dehydrogenase [Aestuariivita sp.]
MASADIGVYGLGTMGSALALNLAGKGFTVTVTNREIDWIAPFMAEAEELSARIVPQQTLAGFVAELKTPRVILFMIPSGAPMDAMIDAVTPLLSEGDTIIDGGNADFHDTRRRAQAMADTGLHYVGMGVSGGEAGARTGPSMMVGGTDHSWQQLRPMVEAIAARYRGAPCVAHLGPDGAGHFVKTVHNGIEYADMQMIAEIYGLLRDGDHWDAPRIGALFAHWNEGPLESFLTAISARALMALDAETGQPMVDVIADRAGQKGTGRWTVIEALKLGQSASTIEGAVAARAWSAEAEARRMAETLYGPETGPLNLSEETLESALMAGRILSHAQGFRVLDAASDLYDWSLDPARIAEIWRAGCIIRSALLDDLAAAFRSDPPQGHLVLSDGIAARLAVAIPALRQTVAAAVTAGLPVPALSGGLQWYDSLTRARGTANLIQAQRDFFGHHGFERIGAEGTFHGKWG